MNESLCATGPVSGCRHVVRPNRSSLSLTRQSGVRDTLVWHWKQGAATSLADFGDPTVGTRYELCLYDAASTLVQRINIGSAMENFLVQIGATEHESFTKDLSFPSYRFRFYEDASRTVIVADPPPAVGAFDGGDEGGGGPGGSGPGDSGDGGGGGGPPVTTGLDSDGNPIAGPNLFLQMFTTDPGRAATTGSSLDFEAFDIPTLRGIGNTAPYWHNNISETLEEVVDLYSDHLFAKYTSLTQPGEKEPDSDGDIGPEEAFTADQKSDLVAFLKRL